ncbi:hypothetical protein V6O07_04585 [Arthrospira platensis SPKY2]
MNFFISSESNNLESVKELTLKILDKGHTIPFIWYHRNPLNNIISTASLDAINNSHVHIILFPIGRLCHIEIGYSISKGKKTIGIFNNKETYKKGPYGHFNQWYENIDQFIQSLKDINSI